MRLSSKLEFIAAAAIVAAIPFAGTRGCNHFFNNRTEVNQAYTLVSTPKGVAGHTEYIRFADGSKQVKIYPSWGHRGFESKLYEDLDGNGKVDRISENSSELKSHALRIMLVRKFDYDNHRSRFDQADKTLTELSEKHTSAAYQN